MGAPKAPRNVREYAKKKARRRREKIPDLALNSTDFLRKIEEKTLKCQNFLGGAFGADPSHNELHENIMSRIPRASRVLFYFCIHKCFSRSAEL